MLRIVQPLLDVFLIALLLRGHQVTPELCEGNGRHAAPITPSLAGGVVEQLLVLLGQAVTQFVGTLPKLAINEPNPNTFGRSVVD